MKKIRLFLLISITFLATSCLQQGYDTIVLNEASPMDDVVPVEYRLQMEQYMPFYNGKTPPNVEGVYLVSPHVLVYSTLEDDALSDKFYDMKIKFSSQNAKTNILSYSEQQRSSNLTGDSVVIMGSGDNFTAYLIAEGTSYNIYVKNAIVISGTLT
jgi:hypothetical protein